MEFEEFVFSYRDIFYDELDKLEDGLDVDMPDVKELFKLYIVNKVMLDNNMVNVSEKLERMLPF